MVLGKVLYTFCTSKFSALSHTSHIHINKHLICNIRKFRVSVQTHIANLNGAVGLWVTPSIRYTSRLRLRQSVPT